EEIPQNASVEVNKNNENISLQQIEQTNMDVQTQLAEATIEDNEDTSKQSWAEMMDKDSDNLKDITNATNPWALPSTSETNIEYTNTENNILHNKKEETQLGLNNLSDDCFLENIDDILRLPEQEIESRNPYGSGRVGRSKESALNEENTHEEKVEIPFNTSDRPDEEMEVKPTNSLKDTKEEITNEKRIESPITASTSLDIEMVVESSNPLRDKLADLYGNAGNKENLPPVVVEANTSIGDMQASMLSQVKNIEPMTLKW
ncbi:12292_t:CDS:2, partial [Gigaspora margarita]